MYKEHYYSYPYSYSSYYNPRIRVTACVDSAPAPCSKSGGPCGSYSGESNRSSKDVPLRIGFVEYRVSAPTGVTFEIKRNYPFAPDSSYGRFKNGDTIFLQPITGSWVFSNFYIANPNGASVPFKVCFEEIGSLS